MSFVTSVPQHPLRVDPVGLAVHRAVCTVGNVRRDKANFNVRLSSTGNQKQKDPGKAMLVTFGSQIGTVALGALFAFPTYYSRLPWFSGWTPATARTSESRPSGSGSANTPHNSRSSVNQANPADVQWEGLERKTAAGRQMPERPTCLLPMVHAG